MLALTAAALGARVILVEADTADGSRERRSEVVSQVAPLVNMAWGSLLCRTGIRANCGNVLGVVSLGPKDDAPARVILPVAADRSRDEEVLISVAGGLTTLVMEAAGDKDRLVTHLLPFTPIW